MRKIASLLMALLLAAATFTACNNNGNETSNGDNSVASQPSSVSTAGESAVTSTEPDEPYTNGNGIYVTDFDKTKYNVSADGITQNVNMPWYDALLGAKYNIKLPDGSKKEIEIAECTKDGDEITIAGTGLEERGGLYRLRINHVVPDKLSDIEKESLQDMKAKIKESNN